MPQDRETGEAGRVYGLKMARGLAKLLGAKRASQSSNEVLWNGKVAVIKSCRPQTSSLGVTASMLPRLQVILAAFEDDDGQMQVFELDAAKFRVAMYDSRSAAAVGGRVKMVSRTYARAHGRPVARYTSHEVIAAAE